MSCFVSIKRLTEAQIQQAIAQSIHEDEIPILETEDDVHLDEFSDGESDNESAYEVESDEADFAEDAENEDAVENADSKEFIGRDGTVWRDSPHPTTRISHNVNRTAMNKVNLRGGQKVDTAEGAFECLFTADVINMIVKYTNLEANRVMTEWKDIDEIELRAFIGLLITAGIERSSKRNYVEFYDSFRRPTNISSNNGSETISIDSSFHSFRR